MVWCGARRYAFNFTVFAFLLMCVFFFVFFFQAEDGIRDYKVTGVQTCALPILYMSTNETTSILAKL